MHRNSGFWTQNNYFSLFIPLTVSLLSQLAYGMEHELPTQPPQQSFFNRSCSFVLNPIKIGLQRLSNGIKGKIPQKMQNPFYWSNSFINGMKTNAAFALLATFAYPLNIVSGKNVLLLQAMFLTKTIICVRLFSNNEESIYCNLCFPGDGRLINFERVLIDNGVFLNDLIAPYSLILFSIGLSCAGVKQIAELARRTTIRSVIFNRLM